MLYNMALYVQYLELCSMARDHDRALYSFAHYLLLQILNKKKSLAILNKILYMD
jgi:hypothetical protein